MGRHLHRTGVGLTLAAIAAGLAFCAALLDAGGAFASSGSDTPKVMTYITGLPTSPYVWDALTDGSSPEQLGQASSALVSPNSAYVAAVSVDKGTNAWTLWLYPTSFGTGATATATLIPKRPQPMSLLAWSPDSKWILVTVGTSPAQLMVVDTTTQQSHAVATGVIYGASFAPNSDSVVYALSKPGDSAVNVYTTSANGTGTRQLTHDNHSELPLWGSSGIVYSHETARAKNPYPELQLWLMNADGSDAHQLPDAGVVIPKQLEGLVAVGESAVNHHLLANLVGPTGANYTQPYTVDLSGAKPIFHALTTSGYIGEAISTYGNFILVTKGAASDLKSLSVETFPWAGGKPTTIVKQGGYASWNR